jgi:putative cell wall-binding protein
LKHRTHRLRRALAAVTLGVGALGGIVLGATSTAGAATTTKAMITSTTKTLGTWVGTTQAAGTVTIKLTAAGTFNAKTITLKATNTPATHTVVKWSTAKVTSTGAIVHTTVTGLGTTTITITVTSKATGSPATILVHTVRYTTNAATENARKIVVTPASTGVTFTPTTVSNATYPQGAPTAPKTIHLMNLTARPVPPIGEGTKGRAVGSWLLTLTAGTTSTASTRGVLKGSHVQITLEPHGGVSHCATTNTVVFSGTPKLTVTTKHTTHVTSTPKVSASLSGNNGCTGFFAPNVLTVTFTSTVHFNHATGMITILITTVKYSVAPKTTNGTVTVSESFYKNSTTKTGLRKTTGSPAVESTNAVVSHAYVMANTPTVTIAPKSFDAPISPISIVESVAGTVPKGYVCITLGGSTRATAPGWKNTTTNTTLTSTTPMTFNATSKLTLKVASGNATASAPAYVTTGKTSARIVFKVTSASTTGKPSTFTLSELAVNDYSTTFTAMPLVTAWYSTSTSCARTKTVSPTDNVAVAFKTGRVSQQIYGATADATAAAEVEHVYGRPGFSCPTTLGGHHPMLLARDTFYSDALASQYLAAYLNTGTLLTHPKSLPSVTESALKFEGITTVYVIGGPLAVSTTVVAQLQTQPVYKCGGRALTLTATGSEKFIKVERVAGPTEYATAQVIAERVPKATIFQMDAQNAYANGKTFNDTTGTESSKPLKSGKLVTAILATGNGFQDAMSASALSYATHMPVILTTPGKLSPQAISTLQTLNVQQVFLMGGPLAVSNAVVTQLEAMTVSVLRIAGKTYTDTAVELAKFELSTFTTGGLGWYQGVPNRTAHGCTTANATQFTAMAARGTFFTDGLAGAVLESCGTKFGTFFGEATRMPLFETFNPSTVGAPLTAFLKLVGIGGTGITTTTGTVHFNNLLVLGGPLAVNPSTIAAMETDLKS